MGRAQTRRPTSWLAETDLLDKRSQIETLDDFEWALIGARRQRQSVIGSSALLGAEFLHSAVTGAGLRQRAGRARALIAKGRVH